MHPQQTVSSFTIRCPNAADKSQTHIRVLVDGPLPLVGLSKLPPEVHLRGGVCRGGARPRAANRPQPSLTARLPALQ